MKKEILESYWEILKDTEDLLSLGYRKQGRVKPNFSIPLKPKEATASRGSDPLKVETGSNRPMEIAGDPEKLLAEIACQVSECKKCPLSEGRTRTVPGLGVINPLVMVIGEGPGAEEDKTGMPFVGRAGQYLDKWLNAIGLSRESNCFIGNIVKCRPPGNRDPKQEEMEACLPYLLKQIEILKPKAILTAGRISSQVLIGREEGIGRLRGQTYQFRGIPLIPTYHPSGVLRSPDTLRAPVWEDLKRLKILLDTLSDTPPDTKE